MRNKTKREKINGRSSSFRPAGVSPRALVVQEIGKRLGTEAAKGMHFRFTEIEYTDKGEKCHYILDEEKYGPNFEILAKVITEFNLKPVVICENPMLDMDAMKMRNFLQKELEY